MFNYLKGLVRGKNKIQEDLSRKPEIIGEGAYGCVYKPALTCKNKEFDSENREYNKISKLMRHAELADEMAEYNILDRIDRNNSFNLGKPKVCIPENTAYNLEAMKGCKITKNERNFDKLKLMLIDYGGNDLALYGEKVKHYTVNSENIIKMEKFWIEIHRAFYGIKIYNERGYVHRDIKPHNIVYNEEKNRINFIDFGLMGKISDMKQKAIESRFDFDTQYWIWPFEMEYINRNQYNYFAKKSLVEKEKIFKKIQDNINAKRNDKKTEIIGLFASFIFNKNNRTNVESTKKIMNGYQITLTKYLTLDSNDSAYKRMLDKTCKTIDTYGLGITLLYMLTNSQHLLPARLVDDFTILFFKMIDSDMYRRYEINEAIAQYEYLLERHGLLKKYQLQIENHMKKRRQIVDPVVNKRRIEIAINITGLGRRYSIKKQKTLIKKQEDELEKELNPVKRGGKRRKTVKLREPTQGTYGSPNPSL
jgi:hypothetical protein